jgi:hypothetical protein
MSLSSRGCTQPWRHRHTQRRSLHCLRGAPELTARNDVLLLPYHYLY